MKYVIFFINGYNIIINMFYNLCLRSIDVVWTLIILLMIKSMWGSNQIYLDVIIHKPHTLMGTFGMYLGYKYISS
jgi:hypothetical protein